MVKPTRFGYTTHITNKCDSDAFKSSIDMISDRNPGVNVSEIVETVRSRISTDDVLSTDLFIGFPRTFLPDVPTILKNEVIMTMRKCGVITVTPFRSE